ncbi:uncharacterized protein SCDLUD_001352 [Saccharomycodes ludwigii]|uniref:uncharacterized protein n=1 Tax=Saccharomycodes ludwigii TaxID=36035 RepID=UPI001E81C819|nr:hypothetical protein SCDLUD_001352 [Saccharomycodes ludwigii]KAH3901589.1 hypothetical protein SCDLUD_001352 [Saccharomycodes ludwigii]
MTQSANIISSSVQVFIKPNQEHVLFDNVEWKPINPIYGILKHNNKTDVATGVVSEPLNILCCEPILNNSNNNELYEYRIVTDDVDFLQKKCLELKIATTLNSAETYLSIVECCNEHNVSCFISSKRYYYHEPIGINTSCNKNIANGSSNADIINQQHGNQNFYIYVFGNQLNVISVESSLRTLIDMKEGKFVKYLKIPSYHYIPLIGGIGFQDFKTLSSIYNVNIYLPTLLPVLNNNNNNIQSLGDTIFITGDLHGNVLLAVKNIKEIIQSCTLYSTVLQNILIKDVYLSPMKLKYIAEFYKDDIIKLMVEYSSFIEIDYASNSVIFYASDYKLLKLAAREFARLFLMDIYEFEISGISKWKDMLPFYKNIDQYNMFGQYVIQNDSDNFKVSVIGEDVVPFIKGISRDYNLAVENNLKFTIYIELLPEFREFISGKKNGKFIKIMDTFKINLKTVENTKSSNGKNTKDQPIIETIFVALESDNLNEAVSGLDLLLQEVPAEESFYIPEAYHRSIIGTGGSLIQSVMKKHNVFIQFYNTFNYPQNSFNFVRFNNVIIRCPSKNKHTIRKAKEELLELASRCSGYRDDNNDNDNDNDVKNTIKISKNQYNMMTIYSPRENRIQNKIGEFEEELCIFINFPSQLILEDEESVVITIKHNNSLLSDPKQHLNTKTSLNSTNSKHLLYNDKFSSILPREYRIQTSYQYLLGKYLNEDDDFVNTIKTPILAALNISMEFTGDSIILVYHKEKANEIINVVSLISDFLKNKKNIEIISKTELHI